MLSNSMTLPEQMPWSRDLLYVKQWLVTYDLIVVAGDISACRVSKELATGGTKAAWP